MITEIKTNDTYANQQMDTLLAREGIRRDKNLDYSCGIFNDDYELLATGSCFKNTIRCTAVADDHQGEGLLNQIVSHLMAIQAERGNGHVFLYTKPDSLEFFSDIGFYEIVRTEKVVFMENRKSGFDHWLEDLMYNKSATVRESIDGDDFDQESFGKNSFDKKKKNISAIVMNANPFTKGHRYLVEKAAQESGLVHLFVLSEEASPIPFSVRSELVRAGTADLENVICHDSGDYIISSATFPGYFLGDEESAVRAQAELDIKVFSLVARRLGISVRYAGDEPYSRTTEIYNQVMESHLPEAGVNLVIVPRLKTGETVISASVVRKAIVEGRLDDVAGMLPETTLEFFRSEAAGPVISALREAGKLVEVCK